MDAQGHGTLEALDRGRALELLGSVPYGRLAFCIRGTPHVEVVNFVLDGPDPAFRIGVSSKLAALGSGAEFALQADQIDASTRTGWAVTVVGPAHTVEGDAAERIARQLSSWAGGDRTRLVKMNVRQVFGRTLGPAAP